MESFTSLRLAVNIDSNPDTLFVLYARKEENVCHDVMHVSVDSIIGVMFSIISSDFLVSHFIHVILWRTHLVFMFPKVFMDVTSLLTIVSGPCSSAILVLIVHYELLLGTNTVLHFSPAETAAPI